MKKELAVSPEELKIKFEKLKTLDDLADLLEIPKSKLYYYAYKCKLDNHYKRIDIPKKYGGIRRIYAPSSPLKLIQKKLNQVFQAVYFRKASVHGFVQHGSILTNASRHLENGKKKYVFNADIKDFFPTITMGRVENLLKAKPYSLPTLIAETIARLVCYRSVLPQGAPSSPIISNMICAKMDTQLRRLAQANKCIYTRYADDITISTTLLTFPGNIATLNADTDRTEAGVDFQDIVKKNGFKLNKRKIRLQTKYRRQEITGLTVNSFPNVPRKFVRQIRAMLFAWEKYGYERAHKEYVDKYSKHPENKNATFKKTIYGKLEFLRMVKGNGHPVYLRLADMLAQLDPDFATRIPKIKDNVRFDLKVLTEGPSDWKHLKAALMSLQEKGEFIDLNIEFHEETKATGDRSLLNHCRYGSPPLKTEFCIFDRDSPDIMKQVIDGDTYKKWNARMYSFSIPVPSHRVHSPEVCIELYYRDEDITRVDTYGRRLFLSSEFHEKSGRHKSENLNCTDINKVRGKLTVIENSVYDTNNNNVALPKNDFATYILNNEKGFTNVDFSEFRLIFETIRRIAIENRLELHNQ